MFYVHFSYILFILLIGPQWGEAVKAEKLLDLLIAKVLRRSNGLQCVSVAIPAISCGIFSRNPTDVKKSVNIITKSIIRYISQTLLEHLQFVRIVVIDPKLIKLFVTELKKHRKQKQ